jgi:hypothetical protein
MKSKIHDTSFCELAKQNKEKKLKRLRKTIKTTFALVMLTLLTFSCSKNDETPTTNNSVPFPEENFLAAFLAASGFDQVNTPEVTNPIAYYSWGFSFKPKVNGTINSVVLKLPSSDGDVKVRIWKVSTQALLKEVSIIVATNNLAVTKTIEKLPLLKDEEYLIVMDTNSYFERKRSDNQSVNFPVEANNIKLTGIFNSSLTNTFPGFGQPNRAYYFGDLSFNFQQTE